MSKDEFVHAFGWVFEHSPWFAERLWTKRPFSSLRDVQRAVAEVIEQAGEEERLALIRSHPDLGSTLSLSPASLREQRSAGLHGLDAKTADMLRDLNASYRARFGFPFVMAVHGKNIHDVLAALRARLKNTQADEQSKALKEIGKIAFFRIRDRMEHAPGSDFQPE
ncbi:OHCU decarboxylase [Alicyclobacillus cellulosilyticus]|uniref:2-oxo-4-hydroxy-4-carboxy-5-ureidoimidazoline decarboxylase n=1 Tax=Alicyclobacillus cellulosilyticus TaxID=1003997 RepID=A0A917NLZ5_9BACL|nr:2-oxo-4-hydroxy-4-carboxy-5-ureidoimidazoline decarboxylase [Alicyclobacillus cellulosilyticus]GGJ10699.1 OHCU decarboxylase [Alicyclobacillus cellulosilyticus]